ncbi:transmembrane protein 127-like [Mercenaria mercenaria]|uniref:transmembrane protein 127-like n=1 Tax=Mercenaria mercenaria TaxID=6596 RepID=UPI001E1D5786|nr:transmembrane protein 127-like [Mercenaria mercenaria]
MPSRSEGRESSSRRSRSRRSRSRHREHHRHRRTRLKRGEKNFAAAVCNMLAIVLICTSLAEPKWIKLHGGGCMVESEPLHHLGAYQFFFPGKFISQERDFTDDSITHVVYQFGPNIKDKMDNCVTFKAALLMKTVIAFCFLAIISSLAAFILDLTLPKNRPCKLLRVNAIPSIVTVILSVVINLFCYWLTTEVETLQKETKAHPGSKVIIDFDISFYLVTAGGGLSVIATAFNCLKRHPLHEDSQGESLLDDYEGMDILPPPVPEPPLLNLPPPPAYSP